MAAVTLHGQEFPLVDEPNEYLLTKFAALAADDVEVSDPEAGRLMMKLLKSFFDAETFRRFDTLCEDTPTDGDDLLNVVSQAWEHWVDRPTSRPSDSSAGPQSTPQSSGDGSFLRVIQSELDKGRPDLAYAIAESARQRPTG